MGTEASRGGDPSGDFFVDWLFEGTVAFYVASLEESTVAPDSSVEAEDFFNLGYVIFGASLLPIDPLDSGTGYSAEDIDVGPGTTDEENRANLA